MKLVKDHCEICGENNKSTLHIHHLVEQHEVGTSNDLLNCCVICANCHNKVHHSNELKIIGVYPSTNKNGRTLVYELNGVSNIPGINKPYIKQKPKGIKI